MLDWLARPFSPRVSEAGSSVPTGSVQGSSTGISGISDAESMAPSLMTWLEGIKVGYGGHKPGAKFAYGGSVHAEK